MNKPIGGRTCTLTGYWYPSVTEILRITESPERATALRKWQHKMDKIRPNGAETERQAAADRGTAVHSAIEIYLQTGEADENADTWEYLERAILPLKALKQKKLMQEMVLFNYNLNYCGRLDLLTYKNNQGTIVEFKTSKRAWLTDWAETAFTQAAAYSMCAIGKLEITTLEIHVLSPGKHQCWKGKPEEWQKKWLERLTQFQEKIQTGKKPTITARSRNGQEETHSTISLEKAYPGFYTPQ